MLKMADKNAIRSKFVTYLSEQVEHQFSKDNVENINNDLINQTTSVGSGNVIKPYEITQDALLTSGCSSLNHQKARLIHEVGFIFEVGPGVLFGKFSSSPKKSKFLNVFGILYN